VKGSIDDYALTHYKLMPMGEGKLFLPVKAAIRKFIKKKEGDHVYITLEFDESPIVLTQEIISCLSEESLELISKFNELKEGEKKGWIDRIHSAKNDPIKAKRIVELIESLLKN